MPDPAGAVIATARSCWQMNTHFALDLAVISWISQTRYSVGSDTSMRHTDDSDANRVTVRRHRLPLTRSTTSRGPKILRIWSRTPLTAVSTSLSVRTSRVLKRSA